MKFTILFYLVGVVTACIAVDLGHIENFHVEDFGTGYIKLRWDFVEGDTSYALHKYSLTIDSDLTSEFKCTSPTCTKLVEDLEACVKHDFDLTPIFYDLTGSDMGGDLVTTSGYTTDELPGPVNTIRVTADNDVATSLQWNPPTLNKKCVDVYDVCFRLDGETNQLCAQTNSSEVTVHDLSACGTYHVTVTPVTQSGKEGPTVENVIKTHEGVPGVPRDVEVGLITEDTIQLLWNNPSKNLLCLYKFQITIGETHALMVRPLKMKTSGFDNEFTFTPLFPCTAYTIDICSANEAEMLSDKVYRYASTNETEPLAPPTVTVNPSGPNTIDVSWGDNENDRCAGGFQVCWNDGIHPIEQCQEIGDENDNSLTIHDLVPCSNYDITVTVQSPDGTFFSNATSNSTSTQDVRPGPVVNLKVTEVKTNEITIKYLPPEVDPQCVKEIVTRVIDEEQKSIRHVKSSEYQQTINGLKACTDYRLLVSTVSPSGLESEVREVRNMTADDVPSEPQMLEATGETDHSISLQWFQPATNPRCATEYVLNWVDDEILISDSSTFKVQHIVDNLRPCVEYTFTLKAQSSAGEGPQTTLKHFTSCS